MRRRDMGGTVLPQVTQLGYPAGNLASGGSLDDRSALGQGAAVEIFRRSRSAAAAEKGQHHRVPEFSLAGAAEYCRYVIVNKVYNTGTDR